MQSLSGSRSPAGVRAAVVPSVFLPLVDFQLDSLKFSKLFLSQIKSPLGSPEPFLSSPGRRFRVRGSLRARCFLQRDERLEHVDLSIPTSLEQFLGPEDGENPS